MSSRIFRRQAYYPVVVFAGNATLKDIKSSVPVIYWNGLNGTIKAASTKKCLSSDDVLRIKKTTGIKGGYGKRRTAATYPSHTAGYYGTPIENRKLDLSPMHGKLKLRNSRNGKFYGCENYPRCRFTMSY